MSTKCENYDELITLVIMLIEDEIKKPPEITARALVRELIDRYQLEFSEF